MVYKLSDLGRSWTYKAWKKAGGCGLPNNTRATGPLGPMAHWAEDLSLGDIEDACPYSGRCLARFAIEHLERPVMAVPY